jgi:hypothetical protein
VSTNELAELGVMLPAKWIRVDLDPETRAASHAAIVAERGGPALEQGATEAGLAGLLEGVARAARAAGGVYAAFYSDVLGGRQVAASLVISVVEATGAPPPPEADTATLAASLRNLLAGEGEAEVRELPVGPAVRLRRQSNAPVPGGGASTAPVMNVRYVVPLPGLRRLAVLEFSTPNLALGDAFADLFDTIAASFSWN